ncbi:hypothetical protein [Anabaena sp. CCY 9910]|uniref:hypothetical protein n=1 Tax=Anabaena sp. CCY 9910 TaxID=3103870 RepID=UPI0039E1AF0D
MICGGGDLELMRSLQLNYNQSTMTQTKVRLWNVEEYHRMLAAGIMDISMQKY